MVRRNARTLSPALAQSAEGDTSTSDSHSSAANREIATPVACLADAHSRIADDTDCIRTSPELTADVGLPCASLTDAAGGGCDDTRDASTAVREVRSVGSASRTSRQQNDVTARAKRSREASVRGVLPLREGPKLALAYAPPPLQKPRIKASLHSPSWEPSLPCALLDSSTKPSSLSLSGEDDSSSPATQSRTCLFQSHSSFETCVRHAGGPQRARVNRLFMCR